MKCPNCGGEIIESEGNCRNCGWFNYDQVINNIKVIDSTDSDNIDDTYSISLGSINRSKAKSYKKSLLDEETVILDKSLLMEGLDNLEAKLSDTQIMSSITSGDLTEEDIEEVSSDITDELENYDDDFDTKYIDGLEEAVEMVNEKELYQNRPAVYSGSYHKEGSSVNVGQIVAAILIGILLIAIIVLGYFKIKGMF